MCPEPVTRLFNDAPVSRLSAHFMGRGRDLDQLEEMLNRTQDGKPSCCVIHGMPGVGKSALITLECDQQRQRMEEAQQQAEEERQRAEQMVDET